MEAPTICSVLDSHDNAGHWRDTPPRHPFSTKSPLPSLWTTTRQRPPGFGRKRGRGTRSVNLARNEDKTAEKGREWLRVRPSTPPPLGLSRIASLGFATLEATTGLPAYSDTLGNSQNCQRKQVSLYPLIFSLRRFNFGPKTCHCSQCHCNQCHSIRAAFY